MRNSTHPPTQRRNRTPGFRRLVPLNIVAFVSSVLVGAQLAGVGQPVPAAYAACQGVWPTCALAMDPTRTSSLLVAHADQIGGVPPTLVAVEPDSGETWRIVVNYSPAPGAPCVDVPVTVTADVTWTGSAWNVVCTGCNALVGPVFDVGICDDGSCGGPDHAWSYVLTVDALARLASGENLSSVVYTTTSVDDGDALVNCAESYAVSPTSQTWTETDTTFPCSYDCNFDESITIIYN